MKQTKPMILQFIYDNKGNTTSVFIPIEERQSLKTKYTNLKKEEAPNLVELAPWQKQIIDKRLSNYYKNSADVAHFDKTINDIEKSP